MIELKRNLLLIRMDSQVYLLRMEFIQRQSYSEGFIRYSLAIYSITGHLPNSTSQIRGNDLKNQKSILIHTNENENFHTVLKYSFIL